MGEWLNIIRFEPLTSFFKGITFLGNEWFLYLLLPVLYWCWKKRSGVYLIILVIIAAYLNFLLKNLIAWERPPTDLWLIDADGYSFPSSHAVAATVIWGYLAYEVRKRWFTVLAISLIILIALSRVYLGVHYPQDVLAGIAVGALLLHFYRWMVKWFRPGLAKVNNIVKGGSAILISIIILILQPNGLVATATGMFAGVVIGFLLEPHFADFDPGGRWYQNIVKAAVGLVVLMAILQGLEWTLPGNASFKWFQFFAVGTWMTGGAPWLFVQLKLARREL